MSDWTVGSRVRVVRNLGRVPNGSGGWKNASEIRTVLVTEHTDAVYIRYHWVGTCVETGERIAFARPAVVGVLPD